jgi:elongation factor G
LLAEAEAARQLLVEAVCELDDDLMEIYLDGKEPEVPALKAALRKGTLAAQIVPVFLGSAFKNKGIQPLLDAVVDYLPSPLEVKPPAGLDAKGAETTLTVDNSAPAAAMAFKLMNDPYVGQLTFLRVYAGSIKSGDTLLNSSRDKKERIGRLLKMHANQREEVKEVHAGDIVAAVGLKVTSTGDSLCAPEKPLILETLFVPEPVIGVAVRPASKPLAEKLGQALNRLAAEDPSFPVRQDTDTGQTVIYGMGELHLEIIVDRLKREFKVEAEVGAPQVAYRERINKTVNAEGRYVRQSGGRGQYGHVKIEVAPGEPGSGVIFEDKIVGGVIPKEYIAPTEKGIRDACEKGVLAGFPLVDLVVTLTDGSFHEVDSNERAFFIAGSMALREAAAKANPGLLEPVMKLEVTTPEEYLGDVMGDISSRRGRVQGMDSRPGVQVVAALTPLAAMFGYATDLRSATQGRATFSMEFAQYEPLPVSLAQEVIEKAKAGREAGQTMAA